MDILFNFINNNASKPKNIIPENNNIRSNTSDSEDKNTKENVDEIDLLKRIEMLEKEIKNIKIRETKSNNTHTETLNGLKKEIDALKIEQIEMKQNYDFNENKIFKQLKKQEDKLEQLEMANKIMNEKMKKIENKKDTIKACGISQSIINFITYAFGENISQKFTDKVSFIQKYIDDKINKEENKSLLLEELKQLVTEIETLKYDGDISAHSEITLQSFFDLVKGCENVKKILLDLNLSSMLTKFNEMYELEFSKKNYDDVYASILTIMDSKKDLFYANFGF